MDAADLRLLNLLQEDSSRSIADLAAAAGLSHSACHRRMRELEQRGVIVGYGARVDTSKLGLSLHARVEISLTGQSREVMERFEAAVQDYDEILQCHLMSGAADYILEVAARDIAHFDTIHRECLSRLPGVSSMRSSFSIRLIKGFRGYKILL